MAAYYNEFDPQAAAWLRELIARGLIADGIVDERSIHDVQPADLAGFTQVHFFAGIGGWSLALRLAGWPDDRPVWTGSCPCQPFSVAGQGKGAADERHLWPNMFRLICECRPHRVYGEQVSGAIAHGWLDGISADLEGEGYAVGAVVLGAHSVGAPHIRQRLYWMANAMHTGRAERRPIAGGRSATRRGGAGGLADTTCPERRPPPEGWNNDIHGHDAGREETDGGPAIHSEHGRPATPLCPNEQQRAQGVGQAELGGRSQTRRLGNPDHTRPQGGGQRLEQVHAAPGWQDAQRPIGLPGVQCPWSDSRIIHMRDGKHRRIPVEPALFPLADGLSYKLARRGSIRPALLKGAGNAICPQTAAAFIAASLF